MCCCLYTPKSHSHDDDNASFGTLVLEIVTPVVAVGQHDNDTSALNSDGLSTKAVALAFCKKLHSSVSDKLRNTQSCTVAMESVFAIAGKN